MSSSRIIPRQYLKEWCMQAVCEIVDAAPEQSCVVLLIASALAVQHAAPVTLSVVWAAKSPPAVSPGRRSCGRIGSVRAWDAADQFWPPSNIIPTAYNCHAGRHP
ncbi:uncharacterized protein UV8b_06152 [Ustilaginoidea virens]|uniref:Uncharacterized protein n=1 Tax=Ustilaginoidea virens TaxID=1159556 RepID=A0A8E5HUR2_USTVR|nr:uncharacterized protein UV8b_06152 [Ustilaginoidea virens]QUC21911.1 hypothetical protein UV8b_06152 [Ustilaginoidea virens]